MTIPLEDVSTGGDHIDAEALQRDIDRLMNVLIGPSNLSADVLLVNVPGTSATKLATGATTLTWTASAASAVANVTHGMTTPPTRIVATCAAAGLGVGFFAMTGTIGATTFQLQGWATSSVSTSVSCHWYAIG